MKVLVYIRPETGTFMHRLVGEVFPGAEIVSFSEHRGLADRWAGEFLYSEAYDREEDPDYLACEDEIIARCRILRRLDRDQARELARRQWNGIRSLYREEGIDCVFLLPVDLYGLDIMDRLAVLMGIRVIVPKSSFLKGYGGIGARGELYPVRQEVPLEEAEAVTAQLLERSYLPPSETKNVQKTHRFFFRYYFRRKLIEDLYYPLRKLMERDPWNSHYNMLLLKGKKFRDYYRPNVDDCFRHLDDLTFDRETTVYLPLHLIPEATTDYWASDVREAADYHRYILDLLRSTDPRITFIVKEHPAMWGRRELRFYDELARMENVLLLHPLDRSNLLLERVDNVAVDTGTVGVEALLRGKRVLALSENYYYRYHPNAFRVREITMEALHRELTDYDPVTFIRDLLRCLYPSDFVNSRQGLPASDPILIGAGIRHAVECMEGTGLAMDVGPGETAYAVE